MSILVPHVMIYIVPVLDLQNQIQNGVMEFWSDGVMY